MKNTVKCRYKYCKHDSKDIPREEAVRIGGAYYHEDCHKESQNKKQVVDLFLEKINPNIPPPQVWRAVNDLVNKKGIDSTFLLFGLKYYISHKIKLNYPGGLYYVVANKEMEAEYNKMRTIAKKPTFEVLEEVVPIFEYKKPKKKTLDNLLSG